MAYKSKTLIEQKKFLTSDPADLMVVSMNVALENWEIKDETGKLLTKQVLYGDIDTQFAIQDRNQTVYLDTYARTEKDFNKVRQRIDALVIALVRFREAYEDGWEVYKEHKKKIEEVRKEAKRKNSKKAKKA